MSNYFCIFSSLFFNASAPSSQWNNGKGSEFPGWLHVSSDLAIFGAYLAIAFALIYFVRKRTGFPLARLFYLFAGLILACGTMHFIEAIIALYPGYHASGFLKFLTAAISWATVITLLRYIPRMIRLPSLASTNARLEEEAAQRLETERQLQIANDRYEALLLGTRSIVWTTAPDGGFETPQESWQRYTGQSWEEAKGDGWADAVHEEDLPELQRLWKSSLESGNKYQAMARFWNDHRQSYRVCIAEAVPVKNVDGSIREWVGTVSDIEDQHQAETDLATVRFELSEQKHELELVYEAAPVGMSQIDREYRFLRVNETQAKINGHSKKRHIGEPVDKLLPELYQQLYPIYDEIFATGKPKLNIEIVGKTPASMETRTWLASYFPLESQSDDPFGTPKVTAVNGIVQDITDRKLYETRLQQSEAAALAASQAKSEFLANMSHEIRTPMAAIMGYADVLLGHLEDPDNRNCVMVMKRNGEHLLELINDILDLSRIEANRMDVDLETCSLPRLVGDIHSLMHVRAVEKSLQFDVEFDGRVPETFRIDPTRLRQVLINLLGNAIKFTESGEVRLTIRCIGDGDEDGNEQRIEFAVSDTGIGMNDEQMDRLFKPFSQGDSSVTRQYGGSGLGLAISQRLVEMLGGEMDLSSSMGDGSVFYVRLPLVTDNDVSWVQPMLPVKAPGDESKTAVHKRLDCRVLVVDDRRDVRHISQHFLEKAGAKVSTAEDGQQGIDAAIAARDAGEPFDLIVMDMQMPVMDGMQATSQLRSAGFLGPIVALTADAMQGDRDRCLDGGCDDYLSKPIDHAQLVSVVADYTQNVTIQTLQARRQHRDAAIRASVEP